MTPIDELWRCHVARKVSSMGELDTASLLFSLPEGIVSRRSVQPRPKWWSILPFRRPCAACPLCQQLSERVHEHYGRTVADLPCAGRRVILALTVRKFVCSTPCTRSLDSPFQKHALLMINFSSFPPSPRHGQRVPRSSFPAGL